ncbi:MAG: DNA primase [Bacteroidaceae bacterium]|nr:DNA primase [Bacteroidaceae bacterium]
MIPQATIERIIDSANIVDVVSEYVTLRRSGANYKGLCPFHDDKTPSFMVSPSKGICKCFSCGEGGNAVHFIMKIEQLTYVEALKFLAKKYGIEVEDRELTPEQRQSMNERESMFALNEWASEYFNNNLKNDVDGRAIGLAYFRNRGFRDDIIEKFKLGFALDKWEEISIKAKQKGYNENFLVKTGLCYRKDDNRLNDRFRGRVMFPWFNISGKVVAFGGRVLDARTKGVSQKYVNSPESEIYSKARELYGIYQAKKQIAKDDCVYMVEGYTDVISMHQCGIENVVANSGTALSIEQIRLLHRYTNNIVLLYDGDAAGIHAALRGTDMLLAEGMNVKILLLPDGDDPDSFARKHNATEFKAYIEEHQTDFIIFKTNLLLGDAGHDPIKRANLTKDIVKSISVIPEEIVRSTYIHECSERLNISEAVLLNETQKNRAKALEEMKKEAERERERAKYLAQKEQENIQNGAVVQQDEEKSIATTQNVTQTPNSVPSTTASDDPHAPSPEELEYLESLHASQSPFPPDQEASQQPSTPTVPSVPQDVLNIRRETIEDKRFYGLEKMIMRLIVRYGIKTIFGEDENGQECEISLIDFVNNELTVDGLTFHNELYTKMLNEAVAHQNDEGFLPSKFFTYSQDLATSQEAANLMSDKYQLSEREQTTDPEELAPEQIVHLMLDYKFAFIEAELKSCKMQLNTPEIIQNSDACNEIMQRFMNLSNIQRALGKRLGDRIYLK